MTTIEKQALELVLGGAAPAKDPHHTKADTRDPYTIEEGQNRGKPGGHWQGDFLSHDNVG